MIAKNIFFLKQMITYASVCHLEKPETYFDTISLKKRKKLQKINKKAIYKRKKMKSLCSNYFVIIVFKATNPPKRYEPKSIA